MRLLLLTSLLALFILTPSHGDVGAKGEGYATECVTVERTYQDGTSEVNRYGVCPSLAEILADYPTIGGQPVPWALHCEEDEGIMFVGIPDTLVCQTIDDLTESAAACRQAALDVRNVMLNLLTDKDERHIARDKILDLASAQAAHLDVCKEGA